jgi:hypothetical protein
MTTNYEAPHCATSSILLLLYPSLVQIFSLGPCSQTPSDYALPLMWETKFHNHTKQLAELFFLYILTFTFLTAGGKTNDSEPDGSKHSPKLFCSWYFRACNFDLLLLFPSIWTSPHLQMIYSLSLCSTSVLPSDTVALTYTQFLWYVRKFYSFLLLTFCHFRNCWRKRKETTLSSKRNTFTKGKWKAWNFW